VRVGLGIALALIGCHADAADPGPCFDPPVACESCESPSEPEAWSVRRIGKVEYTNSIATAFGLRDLDLSPLPDDDPGRSTAIVTSDRFRELHAPIARTDAFAKPTTRTAPRGPPAAAGHVRRGTALEVDGAWSSLGALTLRRRTPPA
jgi:hypothetical protein